MSHLTTEKNPANVARGLKATMNNDRVSDEAKESAADRRQDLGTSAGHNTSGLTSNQERGYKAALKNPNVSDEAKQHAQDMLKGNLA